LETSIGEAIDSRQLNATPKSTGDSPICQVRKKNIALNLPDWQPSSFVEPAEYSPDIEVPPLELSWPLVASGYEDQQPVTETPVHVERKSDVSSQPVDWEQLEKPKPAAPKYPNITKQLIEGDVYESEEKNEVTEPVEDGADHTVRRIVTTRRQMLPVTELTLEDGVEVSQMTSDVLVGVHIDEFVDILPLGVHDPHVAGLETSTSVEESTEPLETGGTLTRRVTTTTVRQIAAVEISERPEDLQSPGVEDGKNSAVD